MPKRIALLTGGGHISSFHAGMLGVCLEAEKHGYEVIGFRDGYRGTVNDKWMPLTADTLEPEKAGSVLGSSRERADPEAVRRALAKHEVRALIVMGGNDHLGEAAKLAADGLPVVGWPKTMDNDLSMTYFTLGYPTAVARGAQMVRDAHVDALTSSRVHLITIFGRDTDWVVCGAGVWGAADLIVPAEKTGRGGVAEPRYSIQFLLERIQEATQRNEQRFGRPFAVVLVAEGADINGIASHLNEDDFDKHGNVKIEPMKLAIALKDALRDASGKKLSVAIDCASYILRNGPPTALDRRLAEKAGRACVKAIDAGRLGVSSIIRRGEKGIGICTAPLDQVAPQRFMRPEKYFDYAQMSVMPAFAEYYTPALGPPPTKEGVVYKALVPTS
jgi:6-phosphofructokinase